MVLTADSDGPRFRSLNFCFSCGDRLADKATILCDGWDVHRYHLIAFAAFHATCAAKLAADLASEALQAKTING
jgi:hypothetical protein